MRRATLILLVALILLDPSSAAANFRFQPIMVEFRPESGEARHTFQARNPGPNIVALQLRVFARSHDPHGTEHRAPDVDGFVVAPPQFVLEPGQTRAVQVQWIGPDRVERERAYRLLVEQVPVDAEGTPDGSARVNILFNYLVSLYVRPPDAEPDLRVVRVEVVSGGGHDRRLEIEVRNRGAGRQVVRAPAIELRAADGRAVTLDEDVLDALDGQNILAGETRIVSLEPPPGLGAPPYEARMSTR